MTDARTWTIRVAADETTTAIWEPASAGSKGITFICAHGAGGSMGDRSMLAVTAALRRHGIDTVRFNFLYTERRQKRPDPMPRLLLCLRAVVDTIRADVSPAKLVLGGRSMGGRAFSMFVADGAVCDGLLLLAYPLHPPGQPDKLRTAHLPSIEVPVLCINGTKDPFCTPELMTQTLATLGTNWHMHWLDGADHSFHVLKRSGRTDAEVMDEVSGTVTQWMAEWS
jgi:predicted alpha/beta-hydrolase family hydrolase